MSAIKYILEHPLDTSVIIFTAAMEEAEYRSKEGFVIYNDGSLNAAIMTHLLCRTELKVHLLTISGNQDTKAFERADSIRAANATKTIVASSSLTTDSMTGINDAAKAVAIQAQVLDVSEKTNCLPVDTIDLTDWYVGIPRSTAGFLTPLKCLLKTEIEKLATALIDKIGAEGQDDNHKAQQSAIDNAKIAQENPSTTDFNLCTILAAREVKCELLLKAYKDHFLVSAFRRTALVRSQENFDYNTERAKYLIGTV